MTPSSTASSRTTSTRRRRSPSPSRSCPRSGDPDPMANWFRKRSSPPERTSTRRVAVPEGLWVKCNNCGEIVYNKEIERNLKVCPKCDYHFRITARERIDLLVDADSFQEFNAQI